jgi:hypothetical protein
MIVQVLLTAAGVFVGMIAYRIVLTAYYSD